MQLDKRWAHRAASQARAAAVIAGSRPLRARSSSAATTPNSAARSRQRFSQTRKRFAAVGLQADQHANPHNLYAVPREKSVARFKDQIRNLTQRRAQVTLRDMIEAINPIIRGWGNYYRKANVRKLFHRLDGWSVVLHQ